MADRQRILVTGGAGYVGSHACKRLHHAGYEPVTFDNLTRGHAEAVKWGPLAKGDLLDAMCLNQAFQAHRPVAVMHFAARAYVGESVSDPGSYYRNNVVGSLNLIETAIAHGTKMFVFSSSCATYGIPQAMPIVEETAQEPINPYGQTKLIAEHMLADFGRAKGLKWTALRYFNAAGADPEGEIGENHDPETHLVPLAFQAAQRLGPPLTVFGDDYGTPDGTCIRDYVHVSDLADAHLLALESLQREGPSRAYNLGLGQGYSVKEIIESVERVSGLDVPHEFGARRPGDPAVLVADAARVREELGWRPRFAQLDQILATAWTWHSQSGNAVRPSNPPS